MPKGVYAGMDGTQVLPDNPVPRPAPAVGPLADVLRLKALELYYEDLLESCLRNGIDCTEVDNELEDIQYQLFLIVHGE